MMRNLFFNNALFLAIFGVVSNAGAGITGRVTLTDSNWFDIGVNYPVGTEEVYVEVWDPDRDLIFEEADTMGVIFSSESEQDFEYVILEESGVHNGIFHGSIPLDAGVYLLAEPTEEQIAAELDRLRLERPNAEEAILRERAYRLALRQVRSSGAPPRMRDANELDEEGVLEILYGETAVCTYYDYLNDWGHEEEITDRAVLGGISGQVSGIWTVEESPYVIVGDVYVPEFQSLTIEAGVHVRFAGNFELTGESESSLYINGAAGDSVFFEPIGNEDEWTPGSYNGLYFQYPTDVIIAYSVFQFCSRVIFDRWGNPQEANISIESSRFSNMDSYSLYLSYGAVSSSVFSNNEIGLILFQSSGTNCLIVNNSSYAADLQDVSTLTNCTITGNATIGIYIEDRGCEVHDCISTDNGGSGLYVRCGRNNTFTATGCIFARNNCGIDILECGGGVINFCEIHSNRANYDFRNCTTATIDARFNWWGDETTVELNQGEHPRNISRIYDVYDDPEYGFVNYSNWQLIPPGRLTMTLPLLPNYFELISSYVVPDDLNAALVFGNVPFLEIVYQDNGSIYLPPLINTIGDISLTEGYQIFCSASSELTVAGAPLDPTLEYSLAANRWNWLGYPLDYSSPVETALASIADEIVIVMNDEGEMWIPQVLNTLHDMEPGIGYFVFVNQDVVFQYNIDDYVQATGKQFAPNWGD